MLFSRTVPNRNPVQTAYWIEYTFFSHWNTAPWFCRASIVMLYINSWGKIQLEECPSGNLIIVGEPYHVWSVPWSKHSWFLFLFLFSRSRQCSVSYSAVPCICSRVLWEFWKPIFPMADCATTLHWFYTSWKMSMLSQLKRNQRGSDFDYRRPCSRNC